MHRNTRTIRTVWLSEPSDRELLVSKGILSHRHSSSSCASHEQTAVGFDSVPVVSPSQEPNERLESLAQARGIIHTLTSCFPVSPPSAAGGKSDGCGEGAVWLDFVYPTSVEVATVLSWLAPSLPHLRAGTRHWMRWHLENEESEDTTGVEPVGHDSQGHTRKSGDRPEQSDTRGTAGWRSVPDPNASVTDPLRGGVDHLEYYPSYGYGLLRFTALRGNAPQSAGSSLLSGNLGMEGAGEGEALFHGGADTDAFSLPTGPTRRNTNSVLDEEEGEKKRGGRRVREQMARHTAAPAASSHGAAGTSDTDDSFSSTGSSEESSTLIVVSVLLLERAMITFRTGYFKDEDELLPQLQWCVAAAAALSTSDSSTNLALSSPVALAPSSPFSRLPISSPLSPLPASIRLGYATGENQSDKGFTNYDNRHNNNNNNNNNNSGSVKTTMSDPQGRGNARTSRPVSGIGGLGISIRYPVRYLVPLLLSTIIYAVVDALKDATVPLLIETNTVDELALSMQPDKTDEEDLLHRMRRVRRGIHLSHLQLLRKESLIQQLLATVHLHGTQRRVADGAVAPASAGEGVTLSTSPHKNQAPVAKKRTDSSLHSVIYEEEEAAAQEVLARYLHALTLTRLAIENVRRGRDTIHLSSMSVVSGVVARLGQHCHWMDYLNTLQSQIALLVMPINIIPGIMSCNVRVPFEHSSSKSIFWIIVAITLSVLVIGLAHPFYRYYRYALPGSIAPL